ncbi:branched-chain amino acid ABC transporter permease [Enterococcus sp. CSURQ0835]|uniref:branched-chain amino acid ABC transporter permease n=1 Tax=Enterococcus sp. CSURQ0835 TaxID=2681394 RepID=UPI0013573CEB|nr:branched-chain amino acid ABC transporter permease [Enterococcus sp. CSURQ0835]
MKKNLRYNLIWLALIILGYAVLYGLYSAGLVNLFLDNILVQIGINVILAVGLNLIIGISGQFSLGHAGFMAIGAYAAALVSMKLPTYGGFFIGMAVGVVLAGGVAFVVGMPTLRLKGDYLAIATLGVAEIIRILIINFKGITNGPSGLFGILPFVDWQMVYGFLAITTLIVVNYIHSGAGRATLAIREDEIAAESMGVNTTKYKVVAFTLGAITASIAGSLYAGYLQSIAPKDFAFTKSVDILIMVVLGGIGSVTGSFIAAILLGILNMYLQDFGALRMIIYALALIIIMIFKPSGLLGTKEFSVKKIWHKFSKGDDQNASVGN